jgi:hypothetical protein
MTKMWTRLTVLCAVLAAQVGQGREGGVFRSYLGEL